MIYYYRPSLLAQAYEDACSCYIRFPMWVLTPFWDYNGWYVQPYLPLCRVCHRVTAHLDGPVDLNDPEEAQWPGIKSRYTFVDPRLQAFLLTGYEWGAPQTDLILKLRCRDICLKVAIPLMLVDIWGTSTALLGTCNESRWYTNTNYGEVWMHNMDGHYPVEEHLTNRADEWAIPPRFYHYAPYTSRPEGYRERLYEQERLQNNNT